MRVSTVLSGSLSLRLLAFAGGTIALALAVAWAVLGILFERHAERQLQVELERHGIALIAAATIDPQGLPQLTQQPFDPRFDRPASGLYWLLAAPNGELRSRSLWDGKIELPAKRKGSGWLSGNSTGPFEPSVMVVERIVQPDRDGPKLRVAIAADKAPLNAARSEFERETAIFLLALWGLLALAAWVQVRMGLRPLVVVRDELSLMSKAAEARLEASAHPAEIRPLTEAINQVASQRADDITRARQRAKDLAHALKTPLTALRLQIEALPADQARDMMHSLLLVSGAVEGELARTGLKGAEGSTPVNRVVERVFEVVSRTPAGQKITLRHLLPSHIRLPISEEASLELLGALIENAVRHAEEAVTIAGGDDQGSIWITIEDDGPGIPETLRSAALERGGQLDERSGSHGLGLSIAQDLVSASGGMLILQDSAKGGLSVRILWPRSD